MNRQTDGKENSIRAGKKARAGAEDYYNKGYPKYIKVFTKDIGCGYLQRLKVEVQFTWVMEELLYRATYAQKKSLLAAQHIPWKNIDEETFRKYLIIVLRVKESEILFLNSKLIIERLTNLFKVDNAIKYQGTAKQKGQILALINADRYRGSHIVQCVKVMFNLHTYIEEGNGDSIYNFLHQYGLPTIAKCLLYLRPTVMDSLLQGIANYMPKGYFQQLHRELSRLDKGEIAGDTQYQYVMSFPSKSILLTMVYDLLDDSAWQVIKEYLDPRTAEYLCNAYSVHTDKEFYAEVLPKYIEYTAMQKLIPKLYGMSPSALYYTTFADTTKCNDGYREFSYKLVSLSVDKVLKSKGQCTRYFMHAAICAFCTIGIASQILQFCDFIQEPSQVLDEVDDQSFENVINGMEHSPS